MDRREPYHDDLINCCIHAHLEDLRSMGSFFTWNNKNERDILIVFKLDRILVNEVWLDKYADFVGVFQPNALSNHCLSVLLGGDQSGRRKSPFKFFNYWADHWNFLPLVERAWREAVMGGPMFLY